MTTRNNAGPLQQYYEQAVGFSLKRQQQRLAQRRQNRYMKFPILNTYRQIFIYLAYVFIVLGFLGAVGVSIYGSMSYVAYENQYDSETGEYERVTVRYPYPNLEQPIRFGMALGVFIGGVVLAYGVALTAESIKMALIVEDHLQRSADANERIARVDRRSAADQPPRIEVSHQGGD